MHLVEMSVVNERPVRRHSWLRKWAATDRRVQIRHSWERGGGGVRRGRGHAEGVPVRGVKGA